MNIKSLILGSATAALAVTGAQAADAIIIAEPEPVEYVRVCDVYGAGYFYIPGTETCLRISGWVRHQVNVNSDVNLKGTWTTANGTFHDKNKIGIRRASQGTGAQVNLDARSETEYGTLRGWLQLEGYMDNNAVGSDIDIDLNRALIQLGGLYMGYSDSLFASSSQFLGSGLGNYGGFSFADTFDYYFAKKHQIGYQFSAGNGFWAALAVENDGDTPTPNKFTPDVTGKIAYQQAWGGAWLAAAYDNNADGVGLRGGVQANFSPLTVRLDGYYRSNADVEYGPGINLTGPWRTGRSPNEQTRWGVQATALYQINPQFGVAAGLGYYKDLVADGNSAYGMMYGFNTSGVGNNGPAINGINYTDGNKFIGGYAWTAQLGLNWTPVQNFNIGADVLYRKAEAKLTNVNGVTFKGTADATAFRLRFQRNF